MASRKRLTEDDHCRQWPRVYLDALDRWAFGHGVELHFIRPGKPVENAYTESFNGRFRDECLNQCHFPTLAWARAEIEMWRVDYNEVRPHSALGYLAPRAFATTFLGPLNSKDSTESDLALKNEERLSA
ncbi:MAG: transposase [Polyangiaceae bacterium]|nr:transposase [Polyangiaceae bacterium]